MKISIEFNNAPNRISGQRAHVVKFEGRCIGTLYDNRDCEAQEQTYRFLCQPGRISGRIGVHRPSEVAQYLQHADIGGEDLVAVIHDIECWVLTVAEWVARQNAQLHAMLDGLPAVEYVTRLDKFDRSLTGMNVAVLGPEGSHQCVLLWADIAKLIAYGYKDRAGWQAISFGLGDKFTGLEWRYYRGGKHIDIQSGSGTTIICAARTESHLAEERARA